MKIPEPPNVDINYDDQVAVLKLQQRDPVFLTNGCCEPAHGSPEMFDQLGLTYGRVDGQWDGYESWGSHYPLTNDEAELIAEDSFDTPNGGDCQGPYTVLYQGQKWLCIHIWYYFRNDATRHRWGRDAELEIGMPSRDKALADLKRDERIVSDITDRAGGHYQIVLDDDFAEDRHLLLGLLPFDWVLQRATSYDAWKQVLIALFHGATL